MKRSTAPTVLITGGTSGMGLALGSTDAAVRALSCPPGTYNVVDDEPAPAHTWLPLLAQILGVPAPERTEARTPWARGALNTRTRELGWTSTRPSWRTPASPRPISGTPAGVGLSPRRARLASRSGR
ncbi:MULTISPECIES: hypothetical protein [unclassified Streptomyces]|uniref:hypothetical protein n=1 Tax=unclassified Streptomyces TaxID=2593676 RepID=UPI0019D2008A|nr:MULTISPECIES: hypothetical protein [unclassified Streptomyces]